MGLSMRATETGVLRGLARRAPLRLRRGLRLALRRVRHAGWRRRCPVCGRGLREFVADPRTGRPAAMCPLCGAMERHRFLWRYLESETLLARADLRVLHVAPETCFEERLRALPGVDYVSMDLVRSDVMVRTDLQKLVFADAEFDLVLCNHVLEHVPDDAAALRELFRVTSPGGRVVLSVPGPDPARGFPEVLEHTLEDPGLVTPEARMRRFGHPGHLRQYGLDLAQRLGEVGFAVRHVLYAGGAQPAEAERLGLRGAYPIYDCLRPPS